MNMTADSRPKTANAEPDSDVVFDDEEDWEKERLKNIRRNQVRRFLKGDFSSAARGTENFQCE
jgi:hypothetical protein